MTFTGITQTLGNGNIIKQYSYPPPPGSSQKDNLLVNIVFNAQGNPLSATVVNPPSTPTTTTPTSSAVTVVVTTATITSASPTFTNTSAPPTVAA